jgi:hypothetical protein
VLTKLHEVHKFVAAQDMLTEAKAIGARKFVYIFEKAAGRLGEGGRSDEPVHGPPFVTVPEAFDEQMKVKTIELLDSGIKHERVAKLGGQTLGRRANPAAGDPDEVRRAALVYWHELGHGLQERYKWLSEILRGDEGRRKFAGGDRKSCERWPICALKDSRLTSRSRATSGAPTRKRR